MRKAATLLLMLLTIYASANNTDETIFHKGDFEQVKELAAQEGKLFFVDFYADYCYACKLMDETTFVNDQVKDFLKDRYIPYKVDILYDIDGISLKQQYNITVLPTILVFNSSGELVGRYESMLGPVRMINEFSKYDIPANRISTSEPLAQKQKKEETIAAAPVPEIPADLPAIYSKILPKDEIATSESKIQSIDPSSSISNDNTSINGHFNNSDDEEDEVFGFANTDDEQKQTIPKETITSKEKHLNVSPSAMFVNQSDNDILQTEGLFQFTVKPYPNIGYGVQIGAFAEYGNVLREVQKLQDKFSQPILVNISSLDTRVVYKIIVGSFGTRREAISFRRMMQKKGAAMESVIKDLASVKLAN